MSIGNLLRAVMKRANRERIEHILGGETLPLGDLKSFNTTLYLAEQSNFIRQFHAINEWPHDGLHPCALHVMNLDLQLKTLLQSSLPVPAVGLIHMANRIQSNPIDTEIGLHVTCSVKAVTQHPKGVMTTIALQVEQQGTLVYSAESDYLYRRKVQQQSATDAQVKSVEALPELLTTLSLGANAGRQYASVSGDYNPIHLWPITAKLMGFKKAIAHGMFTLSLSLSRHSILKGKPSSNGSFSLENQFHNPAFLPCELDMRSSESVKPDGASYVLINPKAATHKQCVLTVSLHN